MVAISIDFKFNIVFIINAISLVIGSTNTFKLMFSYTILTK